MKGDGGNNLFFDVVMLPVNEFTRMKSNIGLQHVMTPAFKADASFNPVFLLTDTKQVIVPADEPDRENFAKNHFFKLFGFLAPDVPKSTQDVDSLEGFSGAAGECTKADE